MAINASPRSLRPTTKRPSGRGASAAPRRSASTLLADVLNAPLADYYLILSAGVILIGFGIMMVLSSSSVSSFVDFGDAYYYVKRQALFLTTGGVGLVLLSRMKIQHLRYLSWVAVILAFTLLLATFTPLGYSAGGNRNWLKLGMGMRIQPSEFAKLAMIVWGANLLAKREKELDRPARLLVPYVPVCSLLIGLVMAERDLGTAIVMGLIMIAVLFAAGTPLRLLLLGGIGLAIGFGALVVSSPNRMKRIGDWLNPTAGTNEQALQALYALASGGWWGRGLGHSRQKWGLPAAHTDFVLAIVGEELGLFGTLVVLTLFLLLGFAGIRTALRSDKTFTRFCAAGVTAWFMIQAVINMGVVLNLLPVLGVTLPFISYGGSSLLANLLALGVLLACARNEPAARVVLDRRGKLSTPTVTTIVDGGRA